MRVVLFTMALIYSMTVGAQDRPTATAVNCSQPISPQAEDALVVSMICSFYTDEAKELDQKMADSLNQVYQICSLANIKQVQNTQSVWLSQRNSWLDIEILNQGYKDRIESLEKTVEFCQQKGLK